jgi:hypothetical protein
MTINSIHRKLMTVIGACLVAFTFNACILTDAITAPPGGVAAEQVQQQVNEAAANGWLFGCFGYLSEFNSNLSISDCLQESNNTLTAFLLVRETTGSNLGLSEDYYRASSVSDCATQAQNTAFISAYTYLRSQEEIINNVISVTKEDVLASGLFASAAAANGCQGTLEPTGTLVELGSTGL